MRRATAAAGPARAMTLEEWAALDEEVEGELVDGILEDEEMPTFLHEIVVAWLIRTLHTWARRRRGLVASSETKIAVGPRRGRKPDLSVYLPGGSAPPRRAARPRREARRLRARGNPVLLDRRPAASQPGDLRAGARRPLRRRAHGESWPGARSRLPGPVRRPRRPLVGGRRGSAGWGAKHPAASQRGAQAYERQRSELTRGWHAGAAASARRHAILSLPDGFMSRRARYGCLTPKRVEASARARVPRAAGREA